MKLGFLTACLPGTGLEELVKWAAEHGFDALELAAWPVDADRDYQGRQINASTMNRDEAQRIRELFREHRVDISALAYYDNNLHPDPSVRRRHHDHLRRVIDAAEMLGVELVRTFLGARHDKTPAENMKEIGQVFHLHLVQFRQ